MQTLTPCPTCGADREQAIAHVCPVGYWSGREKPHDPVNHPRHYTSHPSGIECVQITEHHNFCVGNAIKYLWRCGLKDGADGVQDLQKAAFYIEREIQRIRSARDAG